MSAPDPTALQLARLSQEVAAMQRRMDNTVRHGPVAKGGIDTAKKRVRLVVGMNVDGTEQLSPWVPYAQQGGKLKIHAPPSEGQNMTMFAPGGDLEQAVAMPLTWSDANASPSDSADENVLEFGNVKFTVQGDSVLVEVGGFSVTISSGGLKYGGGKIEHDGKDIGKSHRHTGVDSGSNTSGPPA